MKTRRDALVEAGLAKAGRGKFSGAALAWLEAQRAAGVKFSDDDAPRVVRVTSEGPKVTTAAPVAVGYPEHINPEDYRFPEKEYVLDLPKGFPYPKGVSVRNVCDTCGYSFLNHICNTPVLFGFPVELKKK